MLSKEVEQELLKNIGQVSREALVRTLEPIHGMISELQEKIRENKKKTVLNATEAAKYLDLNPNQFQLIKELLFPFRYTDQNGNCITGYKYRIENLEQYKLNCLKKGGEN